MRSDIEKYSILNSKNDNVPFQYIIFYNSCILQLWQYSAAEYAHNTFVTMFQVKPQNTIRKLKKRIVKLKSIKKLQKLKCQELPLFYSKGSKLPLRTIPSFYLFSWCLNFVQRHSFHTVLVESPKTMRKLPLSTKCSHQEIR